jgi:hypothetical protein
VGSNFTHNFIATGFAAVEQDPNGWGGPAARDFLSDAQERLRGRARRLRIEPGEALSEAWLYWSKPGSRSQDDVARATSTNISSEFGRAFKAARALTSSESGPYRELIGFEKELNTAAQARATTRGESEFVPLHVAAYGGHDDMFEASPSDRPVPGDDRHIAMLENTEDDATSDALAAGMLQCRSFLSGLLDEDRIDQLFDSIATRVSVSGHGGDTRVARSARPDDDPADNEAIRRAAVAAAAETIAKDRPLKGGPDDTVANHVGVSAEVVRLTTRLLLGSKTPARPLTSKKKTKDNGGQPVLKDAVVLSGVPQLIADGIDPWTQTHIARTVTLLLALTAA